jgi:hypothetical protein
MKRLLAVCLLTVVLSFPALGGRTVPGNQWCEDGTPDCEPDSRVKVEEILKQETHPNDSGYEMLLALALLALMLRYRA